MTPEQIMELVDAHASNAYKEESYDKLRTAIEKLAADAARYQWLMNNIKGFAPCVWSTEDGYGEYFSVNQVQIDAAMEKSE